MFPEDVRYSAGLSVNRNSANAERKRLERLVPGQSDRWLSRDDAAALVNRDVRSIDRWVVDGQLTVYKEGTHPKAAVWIWRDELVDVARRKNEYLRLAQESSRGKRS
jgi:hypothetical protein